MKNDPKWTRQEKIHLKMENFPKNWKYEKNKKKIKKSNNQKMKKILKKWKKFEKKKLKKMKNFEKMKEKNSKL